MAAGGMAHRKIRCLMHVMLVPATGLSQHRGRNFAQPKRRHCVASSNRIVKITCYCQRNPNFCRVQVPGARHLTVHHRSGLQVFPSGTTLRIRRDVSFTICYRHSQLLVLSDVHARQSQLLIISPIWLGREMNHLQGTNRPSMVQSARRRSRNVGLTHVCHRAFQRFVTQCEETQ